jgi:uncharacterized phage-associated protein
MYTVAVERPLQYQFNLPKFLAVMGQLIKACGPMTKLRIVKLLYLLDRRHFNLHGRPVLGDRYLRMDYGPVPTLAKDLIDELEERATFNVRPVAEGKVLSKYFRAKPGKKYKDIELIKEPPTDVLSESELEALNWVAAKFGRYAPSTLVDITHRHPAWRETAPMAEIDYRLFPEGDSEAVEGIAEVAAIELKERGEVTEALSIEAPARSA